MLPPRDPLPRVIQRVESSRHENQLWKPIDYFLARKLAQPLVRQHHRDSLQAGSGGLRNPRITDPELILIGNDLEPSVVADQRVGVPFPNRVQDLQFVLSLGQSEAPATHFFASSTESNVRVTNTPSGNRLTISWLAYLPNP